MNPPPRPRSLVTERAVRLIRADGPVDSRRLAAAVLALEEVDSATATRLLEAAFQGDQRLVRQDDRWALSDSATSATPYAAAPPSAPAETDGAKPNALGSGAGAASLSTSDEMPRAFLFLDGEAIPGAGYRLERIRVLRFHGGGIEAHCDGRPGDESNERLRRGAVEAMEGALVFLHEPPGALRALEQFLDEPIDAPVSLRELARERCGLPARHDFSELMGRLQLRWRETDDTVERAEAYEQAIDALRGPDESWADLRRALGQTHLVDWDRLAFDRFDLENLPRVPGTYSFFDADGTLLYVGKSKNLRQRVRSYFRDGTRPSPRVIPWIDRVHRFEFEATGSELEAILEEARQIREARPDANVQREIHRRPHRTRRLSSILILEPGDGPSVLRAYLIHRDRLIGSVPIGPRGGGLPRVRRLLEDYFFDPTDSGPRPIVGPDLDVELIARWLGANRDRAVAFDPTDLRTAQEVIERLQWFVDQGGLPDGEPLLPR